MKKLRTLTILLCLGVGPAEAQAPVYGGVPSGMPATSLEVEAEIASTTARFEEIRANKSRFETEAGGLSERRDAAREQLYGRTRALYRICRSGMLPVAGGFDALLGHLSRVERLERMVAADMDALRFLDQREGILREEVARAATELIQVEARLGELNARRQVAQQQRYTNAFGQVYLPQTSAAPAAQPMQYGTLRVVGDPGVGASGFAHYRGRLGMPIAGQVQVREARREDGPGLEFLAGAGTMVRSVGDGRVAFAQQYGSYGRLIIVDHGDNFYTVYGGMGRVDVQVGDWLARGTSMGVIAGGSPSALFFEVRRGTRSLDTRGWVGL